jgi:hypothetical protein
MARATEKEEQQLAEELHAKWISSPDDRADRDGQTLATKSHDVIRQWAEERNARPATATRGPDDKPRTLRFDFDEATGGLEAIEWDAWFSVFDERNLAFLYQERKADGNESNFFRLVNPDREDG